LFLFSAEFSIIASGDDMLIFYLTKSIFFHGDVIRDINEKGVSSVYKRVKTIDNNFRKPFEGVINEVRRRNTATGNDRVTRKILKSKEGISENFPEGRSKRCQVYTIH
jgi:hypothetical protein